MNLKRRKSKISYTVMIISDSAKKHMKQFHLKAGAVGAVTGIFFILLVFFICYVVYSSITLSDSLERSRKQMEQITQLKEEKTQLEILNEELTEKVSILSETVNQKVEVEQALAAEREESHLPKGFPLSGSAQIKRAEEETADEEDQDTEQENTIVNMETKEVIFTAAAGINVIASGAGTVTAVDTDVEYGHSISIDHGNGYITVYRNAGNPMVKVGDEVIRGAILYVISEENTDMGYSIKQEDTYIDPMEMIEING
ncbi:MAG: peptidoglycan DD-metalloendopeptidase family protein [Clostridiales bacterium]|nr:peptidoglycan DD-metalloendopeptidase family protein [Clostridiales bacterium]